MFVSHWDPMSVIQRSPMSGAFGTDAYLCDKEGFVARMMKAGTRAFQETRPSQLQWQQSAV